MTKYLLYFCFTIALFSSCRKDEAPVFNQSPDERLNAALKNYQTVLSGAQYGWKAFMKPAGGGEYFFYMKFNDSNRVKMLSDFDSSSAVTLKESSFRLKALQQPSLIFDTYNYLHLLADPNPAVNGGDAGYGLVSDFEFYFDGVSGDSVKLVGRFNKSKLTLVKATQQEYTALVNNLQLGGVERFKNIKNSIYNYWKQFTIGATTYEMDIYAVKTINDTLTITISWLNGTTLQKHTTPFTFDFTGGVNIKFTKPLVNGSTTISELKGLVWNSTTQVFTATSGTIPISIAGAIKGINIDVAAPKRWRDYAATGGFVYWGTDYGFHINGVDDAYKLTSNTNYSFLLFYPQYGTSGGTPYDLLGFVTVTPFTISYGPAFRFPTYTTDGRVIFPYFGLLGTVPTTFTSNVTSTRIKFAEATGYYLVQTAAEEYDMVNALDAKAWISWY